MDQNERSLRRDLAAAYRLVHLLGWDDHLATHMSARLPDGTFLINRFGALFEEVTAASLVRVDMQGNVVSPADAPLNVAGFNIHAGLLAARPDIGCAIHLHTLDGVAVSALEEGFLPLCQTAMLVHDDVAYHAFEGVANRVEERARLGQDLGAHNLMILRNHGTLAVGQTIADAFYRIYTLEWSCSAQIRAMAGGRKLHMPDKVAAQRVGSAIDWSKPDRFSMRAFWPAMLRRAQRECPGFDDLAD